MKTECPCLSKTKHLQAKMNSRALAATITTITEFVGRENVSVCLVWWAGEVSVAARPWGVRDRLWGERP